MDQIAKLLADANLLADGLQPDKRDLMRVVVDLMDKDGVLSMGYATKDGRIVSLEIATHEEYCQRHNVRPWRNPK
jgi:hypothetical protein